MWLNQTTVQNQNKTTLSVSNVKVDCAKECPCGVPTIPVPDQWLEVMVTGGFKVWHIIFIIIAFIVTMIVIYCCFHRCRIPRTKQEIEADLMRSNLSDKFRDCLQDLPNELLTFSEALKKVQEMEEKLEQDDAQLSRELGARKRMGWMKLKGKDKDADKDKQMDKDKDIEAGADKEKPGAQDEQKDQQSKTEISKSSIANGEMLSTQISPDDRAIAPAARAVAAAETAPLPSNNGSVVKPSRMPPAPNAQASGTDQPAPKEEGLEQAARDEAADSKQAIPPPPPPPPQAAKGPKRRRQKPNLSRTKHPKERPQLAESSDNLERPPVVRSSHLGLPEQSTHKSTRGRRTSKASASAATDGGGGGGGGAQTNDR